MTNVRIEDVLSMQDSTFGQMRAAQLSIAADKVKCPKFCPECGAPHPEENFVGTAKVYDKEKYHGWDKFYFVGKVSIL